MRLMLHLLRLLAGPVSMSDSVSVHRCCILALCLPSRSLARLLLLPHAGGAFPLFFGVLSDGLLLLLEPLQLFRGLTQISNVSALVHLLY
jgi:hypothetical protein